MSYLVTGGAGFIGSNVIAGLNEKNYKDIVLVDDFSKEEKRKNYENKTFGEIKWLQVLS